MKPYMFRFHPENTITPRIMFHIKAARPPLNGTEVTITARLIQRTLQNIAEPLLLILCTMGTPFITLVTDILIVIQIL